MDKSDEKVIECFLKLKEASELFSYLRQFVDKNGTSKNQYPFPRVIGKLAFRSIVIDVSEITSNKGGASIFMTISRSELDREKKKMLKGRLNDFSPFIMLIKSIRNERLAHYDQNPKDVIGFNIPNLLELIKAIEFCLLEIFGVDFIQSKLNDIARSEQYNFLELIYNER